jgi:hypothetical protein
MINTNEFSGEVREDDAKDGNKLGSVQDHQNLQMQ